MEIYFLYQDFTKGIKNILYEVFLNIEKGIDINKWEIEFK